jgi:hypothetical protein
VFQPTTFIMVGALSGAGILSAGAAAVSAPPVLRDAQVRIAFTAAESCDVTASYTVEGASPRGIEHRLQAPAGVTLERLTVNGTPTAPSDVIRLGVTLSYIAPATGGGPQTYELAYRIQRSDEWTYRCPIWLPVAPADGRSRPVRLLVELPPDARPAGSSLPALNWSGNRGETTLAHLPSFVRVPFASEGMAPGGLATWDVSRITDVAALLALGAASLLWVWRRRWIRGAGAHQPAARRSGSPGERPE